MRKQKTSYQLLKNYIAIFFITTIFTLIVIIGLLYMNSLGSKDNIYNRVTAKNLMQNDYRQIETRVIEDSGGGLQVVNSHYQVIYSVGKNQFTSNQITVQAFTDFLINSSHKDIITVDYNEKESFWLIVSLPIQVKIMGDVRLNLDSPMQDNTFQMLGFVGFGYLLILFMSTVIYAKITAVSFIKPLSRLSHAIKKIKQGDYTARVAVGRNREFSELELAFNHMAEQIHTEISLKEQSERNRKSLILDISHDLKNPLTSIMGYAELSMRDQDNGKQSEYAKIIYENSVRANELIQDLFELSKLESPEFQLDFVSADFSEYLREEMIRMLPELAAAGLVPEFVIPDEEIMLRFDKKRMNRVLANVLYNAVAYHATNSKFEVILEKLDSGAQLIFINTGAIESEVSDHLFMPFVREEQSFDLNPEGAGLGLAIVKKIITAHGGTIHLNTESNRFEMIIWLKQI